MAFESFKKAFSHLLKKKKKGKPESPVKSLDPYTTPADPPRTKRGLERLRDLSVAADKRKLTLGGQLPGRRKAIIEALKEDDYEGAETLLGLLENDVAAAGLALDEWEAVKERYALAKQQIGDLASWAAPEATELSGALLPIDGALGSQAWARAVQLEAALHGRTPSVATLHGLYPGRKAWADAKVVRERVELRIVALETASDPAAAGFRNRWSAIGADATDTVGKYAEAVTAAGVLDGEVTLAHQTLVGAQQSFALDRGVAAGVLKTLTDHVEVAGVQRDADTLSGKLGQADDLAKRSDFVGARRLLDEVTEGVRVPLLRANALATSRSSAVLELDGAAAAIQKVDDLVVTQAERAAYDPRIADLRRRLGDARAQVARPRSEFASATKTAKELKRVSAGIERSLAEFVAHHQAYRTARGVVVNGIAPLRSHAQASAIALELADLDARVAEADRRGVESSWKEAKRAVDKIPEITARVLELAEGLARVAVQSGAVGEALAGIEEPTATALKARAMKLLATRGGDVEAAVKIAKGSVRFEVDDGMSELDALASAQVEHDLAADGVDADKALAVAKNVRARGRATQGDLLLVSKKVAALPKFLVDNFNQRGIPTQACRQDVTDLQPELFGVTPRGWTNGETWDSVPGMYSGDPRAVVVGTRSDGGTGRRVPPNGDGHGASDLTGHEAGHAFDVSDPGLPKHKHADFLRARESDKAVSATANPRGLFGGPGDSSVADNYFLDASEGGTNAAGKSETFAESVALYAVGDRSKWPNLIAFWTTGNPWMNP